MIERLPTRWRYPLLLLGVWLCLAVYLFFAGDPLGYVILALFGVFMLLPALILLLGNRRWRPGARRLGGLREATWDVDERGRLN